MNDGVQDQVDTRLIHLMTEIGPLLRLEQVSRDDDGVWQLIFDETMGVLGFERENTLVLMAMTEIPEGADHARLSEYLLGRNTLPKTQPAMWAGLSADAITLKCVCQPTKMDVSEFADVLTRLADEMADLLRGIPRLSNTIEDEDGATVIRV